MAVKQDELEVDREYVVTREVGVDGLSPEGTHFIAACGTVLVYVGGGSEGRHRFRFYRMRVFIELSTYYLRFLDEGAAANKGKYFS